LGSKVGLKETYQYNHRGKEAMAHHPKGSIAGHYLRGEWDPERPEEEGVEREEPEPLEELERGAVYERGSERGAVYVRGSERGAVYVRGVERGAVYERGSERGAVYERGSERGAVYERGSVRGAVYERGSERGTVYVRGSV